MLAERYVGFAIEGSIILGMKNTAAFIAAFLALTAVASLTACGKKNDEDPYANVDVSEELRAKIRENVTNTDLLPDVELENKTIKWLAEWNINPDTTGKNKPTELVAFEEKYGGKVEWIQCSWENRYEKLAEMINSGDGVDFFYAGNMDAFPKGAIRGMFVPADDYIDFGSPLWADVQEVNDSLIWNGSHYCIVTQTTGDRVACVYNRKTIQEAGLTDPAELYARGEWDWNAFQGMLTSFVDAKNQHYGIDSWWYEFGIIETTGVAPISLEKGRLVNNLGDPAMERVQNFLFDLYNTGCISLGYGDYGWDSHPEYIGEGKLLFYPVGLYEFYKKESDWKTKFGDDAFFVPMPKDPNASEYYTPVGMEGYTIVKGAQNPEGVARFLDCKRFAIMDEDTKALADQQFRDDYGWTDDMVVMQRSMQELANKNVVLDISTGVSADCGTLIDDSLRLTTRGTPWSETYDAVNAAIDVMIEKINDDPTNADLQ